MGEEGKGATRNEYKRLQPFCHIYEPQFHRYLGLICESAFVRPRKFRRNEGCIRIEEPSRKGCAARPRVAFDLWSAFLGVTFGYSGALAFFRHDAEYLLEFEMPFGGCDHRPSAAPQKLQVELGSEHVEKQLVDFRVGQNDLGVTAEAG